MLKRLKQFIEEVALGESDQLTFAEDDQRLAAAALLFHVTEVDGESDDVEKQKVRELVQQHYQLTDEDTQLLLDLAKARDEEAVDLFGFTSVIKRKADLSERLKIIEMMWEVVFADGHIHEFEDNTIWRVAELLGISSRDRIALRQKVAKKYSSD